MLGLLMLIRLIFQSLELSFHFSAAQSSRLQLVAHRHKLVELASCESHFRHLWLMVTLNTNMRMRACIDMRCVMH